MQTATKGEDTGRRNAEQKAKKSESSTSEDENSESEEEDKGTEEEHKPGIRKKNWEMKMEKMMKIFIKEIKATRKEMRNTLENITKEQQ